MSDQLVDGLSFSILTVSRSGLCDDLDAGLMAWELFPRAGFIVGGPRCPDSPSRGKAGLSFREPECAVRLALLELRDGLETRDAGPEA
jgi:hypothetical protein